MLHIVEPTLNSFTGHCYSLVEAIAQAVPEGKVCVWAGTQSGKFWPVKDQIRPYFFQSVRKIQSFFLFRKLLKKPGKVLVSTAVSTDFLLLDWAASGKIPKDKVYLYVHWVGGKTSTAKKLGILAQRQPNLEVLCSTPLTTEFFRLLGFRSATVPYPRAVAAAQAKPMAAFHHLLVAGAARMDKGFDRITDLVDYLASTQATLPIWIQISATHQSTHGDEVLFQINRLEHSGYSHQTLIENTLSPTDYQALFAGGISIQPYAEVDFQDRVSGVTLDALAAGCPVVVTANTWLGRLVCKHNAGIATSDLSPTGLHAAITRIAADYAAYSQRAARAAVLLGQEHSARAMIQAIFESHDDHDV